MAQSIWKGAQHIMREMQIKTTIIYQYTQQIVEQEKN